MRVNPKMAFLMERVVYICKWNREEGTFKEGKKHGKGIFRAMEEGSGTWKDDKNASDGELMEIIKRLTFLG